MTLILPCSSTELRQNILHWRARLAEMAIGATPCERVATLTKENYVKLETQNPTGSFKIRGAYVALASAAKAGARRGVTASSGNFALALLHASSLVGTPVTVFVPSCTPNYKRAALESALQRAARGSGVVSRGRDFQAAKLEAKRYAQSTVAARFVDSFDHWPTIIGNASIILELIELTQLRSVLVPVGGGGLLAGCLIARMLFAPGLRIIGVVSTTSPSMLISLRDGTLKRLAPRPSFIDGVAVDAPGEICFQIVRNGNSGILAASPSRIAESMRRLHADLGVRAEPAGAIALSPVLTREPNVEYPAVAVVTGGNIDAEEHRRICSGLSASSGSVGMPQGSNA